MNHQAFKRGFFKTAIAQGLNPLQAAELTKRAFGEGVGQWLSDPNNSQMVAGLGGAAAGGLAGAALGDKGHKGRDALLGAAVGGLGGGLLGGNKSYKDLMYGASPDNPIATSTGEQLGPPRPKGVLDADTTQDLYRGNSPSAAAIPSPERQDPGVPSLEEAHANMDANSDAGVNMFTQSKSPFDKIPVPQVDPGVDAAQHQAKLTLHAKMEALARGNRDKMNTPSALENLEQSTIPQFFKNNFKSLGNIPAGLETMARWSPAALTARAVGAGVHQASNKIDSINTQLSNALYGNPQAQGVEALK